MYCAAAASVSDGAVTEHSRAYSEIAGFCNLIQLPGNILVPRFTGFGPIARLINPFRSDTPAICSLRQHLIHHSDDCRFNE
ncbi:hypothetical protein [Morganella morganii]|uniref:hypothetical protein n=1 Tax=Morganella morganii TaxID=582 RepID=UPI0021A36A26|nr:hypothetical protein [Morganella morganii]